MSVATRARIREALVVIGGFTALTCLMTYPVIRFPASVLPNDLGDPLLNAWILAWDADRFLHGFRDLWQAPNFFPYPNTLAYSEHLLGIAVLVAPVHWLSGNPVLTYNVAFFLAYVLAGSGMYLLVRSLTGSRGAAVVAGVAFAFVPFRAAHLPHLQVLMSGWMPIALWALHRYYTAGGRRWLAAFGAAFSLQGLSNGYYLYFFAVAAAMAVVDGLIRTRRPRLRVAAELAVCGLCIGAVLAPVAYAYVQVRQEREFIRGDREIVTFSGDLSSYLKIGPQNRLYRGILPRAPAENELFGGFTLMTLALAGIATYWWRGRTSPARSVVPLYTTMALAALLLSLGPVARVGGVVVLDPAPYRWLMIVMPGIDGLRVPARFAMIVYLAAAVLAGIAVARLLPRHRLIRIAVVALLAGAVAIEGFHVPVRQGILADYLNPQEDAGYAWLAGRPSGGMLELPMTGRIDDPMYTLLMQYRSLDHGHPIVNGFSGYLSPLVEWLRGPGTPIVDQAQAPDVLRALRSIGVRYLTLHPEQFRNYREGQSLLAIVSEQSDQIEDRFVSRDLVVLQLRPLAPPGRWRDDQLLEVPAADMAVSASHTSDRLGLMFDGNRNTRWFTGVRQTGDEWIELRFDRPRAVGRVRFVVTPRSMGDYPRRLLVESSRGEGVYDVIEYEDVVMPELMRGIARSNGPAFIDIDLRGNPSRGLRLRQLGETRVWYWSVDELSLWEVQVER